MCVCVCVCVSFNYFLGMPFWSSHGGFSSLRQHASHNAQIIMAGVTPKTAPEGHDQIAL